MTAHILIVEDDPKLAHFIESDLTLDGYCVTVADNGLDGLAAARTAQPDLLILDWMLPGMSGVDLCRRLRATGMLSPIIMLTAKDEVSDRVVGLDAGADDYLTKPFSMEELLARVRAHLRRVNPEAPNLLEFDRLTLNRLTREVHLADQRVSLTVKEFDLLELLLSHPKQVFTRDQILEKVWGYDFMGESNIIEVYIRALRIKLEAHYPLRLVHTIRGVGYVLRDYA
ncbi:MAG: response regulator transcription factor [Thermosynechococcaceae cyanobacterium MS004]|nr:response regulator transcription factor [Thermosynechococcaceae cyanobacterium MS004]